MAKYFKAVEFLRCTPSCHIGDMDAELLARLDAVRERAGIPLVLNSAYRSVAYELSKGRTGSSAHCTGKAVDIRCNTSGTRYKIVKAALEVGFTRIGIGRTFVHLDISADHSQCVMWDYYNE